MLSNRKPGTKIKPPYRESKLTRILEDSLTYDSQTVMIVNVRQEQSNYGQTKEALNFAKQAMIGL